MITISVLRAKGLTVSAVQGKIYIPNCPLDLRDEIRASRDGILAELVVEHVRDLTKIRDGVNAEFVKGADGTKCLDALNLIDAIIVEHSNPEKFFTVFEKNKTEILAIIVGINRSKLDKSLEGDALLDVAKRVFPDALKPSESTPIEPLFSKQGQAVPSEQADSAFDFNSTSSDSFDLGSVAA